MGAVMWAAVLYMLLMILQAGGRYLWRRYLIGTSHLIASDLRLNLYSHLQKLPLRYYQKVRTGDLMSRATNDIESIRMAIGPGILVTVDALLVFGMIVPVMFWLSWKLSLLAFAFYPFVPWITIRLGNRIDNLFEGLQTKMSNLGAYAQETFGAVRLIKSLVLETKAEERFRELSRKYEVEGIEMARYQAIFSPTLALLTNLGTFLILLLGGMDVIKGALTLGTFVAFQRFVVQLSWPMEAIGWAVTMNKEGMAAHRRLNEILHAPQVQSTLFSEPASMSMGFGLPLLSVRDLQYTYDGAGEGMRNFSLSVASLELKEGTKIGIVGPVGSGKSTLFNLILRLYEPPEDTVFFEGRDVRAIPLSELRTKIASVEQQVFLFSEKITSNIEMGRTGLVPFSEIDRASRVASVHEEVSQLKSGFDTPLGERGVNLSGGQKQRLALTRALVRQPKLLLLDDAFSAVDVHVENQIIENFFAQYPELSVCFASHRLSIMPRMDEVWLIEEGKIIDRGPHRSLLKRSALYQALWEKSERELERSQFEAPPEESGELVMK
jgi:ATP-binding cassette, subfamily B, multidrug efflux pump